MPNQRCLLSKLPDIPSVPVHKEFDIPALKNKSPDLRRNAWTYILLTDCLSILSVKRSLICGAENVSEFKYLEFLRYAVMNVGLQCRPSA